jgi:DnaJ-class molecular chaperone
MELLLVVGAVALMYIGSAVLHPYVKCEACDGKGKHFGGLFGNTFRPCHRCSGSGQKQRLTAAIIGVGKPRKSSSKIQPATSSIKKNSDG